MRRKSFDGMQCPIARSLERVGEWWSILILRDASQGFTRFDEFQTSLGIAPNMLARRLQSLVEGGLLDRRRYQENPPRYEYLLTERGRDFQQVLYALLAWGNRHLAPEGPSVVVIDEASGAVADPVLVDRVSGRPLSDPGFRSAAGPAAARATRNRYDEVARRSELSGTRGTLGARVSEKESEGRPRSRKGRRAGPAHRPGDRGEARGR
jgi:DNA-binding HxlR family transcriptional regulator